MTVKRQSLFVILSVSEESFSGSLIEEADGGLFLSAA